MSSRTFSDLLGSMRQFYLISYLSYGIGYVLRFSGVTMLIPLIHGLIQQDYSFLWSHRYSAYLHEALSPLQYWSPFQIFLLLMTGVLLLTGLGMGMNFLTNMVLWRQKQTYGLRASQALLQKYFSLEESFFGDKKISHIRSQISSIPENIIAYLGVIQSIAKSGLEVIIGIGVMAVISWQVTLWSLCMFIGVIAIHALFRQLFTKRYTRSLLAGIGFGGIVQDILDRRSLTVQTDMVDHELSRYADEYQDMTHQRFRFEAFQGIFVIIQNILIFCALVIIAILLSRATFREIISLSSALVYTALAYRACTRLIALTQQFIDMQARSSSLHILITDILNIVPSIQSGSLHFRGLCQSIEIEGVDFSYDNRTILSDFSASIPAGRITVITGDNGSGKSTFLKLLFRTYEYQSGRILLDGQNIRDIDRASWRQTIGYVSQDLTFFHGTLRENLVYGLRNTPSEDLIMATLKKVGLDTYIVRLPMGLDTPAGDHAHTLSGGQRQRLALARALLGDFSIYFFDEITKSVDKKTEDRIMDIIQSDLSHTTRIIVSHNSRDREIADYHVHIS